MESPEDRGQGEGAETHLHRGTVFDEHSDFSALRTEDIDSHGIPGGCIRTRESHKNPAHQQLRKTLQVTNIVIILATLVPFLINTLYYNFTLNQYERIIENVYSANSLSSQLQDEIYITIWNVVAGKTRFEANTQYELIDRIRGRLNELEKDANSADDSYLIRGAQHAEPLRATRQDRDNIAQGSRP